MKFVRIASFILGLGLLSACGYYDDFEKSIFFQTSVHSGRELLPYFLYTKGDRQYVVFENVGKVHLYARVGVAVENISVVVDESLGVETFLISGTVESVYKWSPIHYEYIWGLPLKSAMVLVPSRDDKRELENYLTFLKNVQKRKT